VMNLENSKHGVGYMNTYLEAGFPRVMCDIRKNMKAIAVPQATEMYRNGVTITDISKNLGLSSVTVNKWLVAAGVHIVKLKPKSIPKTGKFAHLK